MCTILSDKLPLLLLLLGVCVCTIAYLAAFSHESQTSTSVVRRRPVRQTPTCHHFSRDTGGVTMAKLWVLPLGLEPFRSGAGSRGSGQSEC